MKLFIPLISLILVIMYNRQHAAVEVYQVEKSDHIELVGKNSNIYPVTIELNVTMSNLEAEAGLPHVDVVNARSEKQLLKLVPLESGKAWQLRTKYTFFMGDIFAEHDDGFAYQLPYSLGNRFRVGQGYDGKFSHAGAARYAIDFDMPEGTPVHAARAGKVIEIEESYSLGGAEDQFRNKANVITILHSDGTFADYSHLRKNGASVLVGQTVRTGQLLGFSGSTGYVTGPHLHFQVKKVTKSGKFVTLPVRFKTQTGTTSLKEGESYTAY